MLTEDRILVAVTDARSPGPAGTTASALISYTGTYRFDGHDFITNTEAASRPDLLVEQVRHLHFESDTRLVVIPKNNLVGRPVGLTLVWERVA